MPLQKRLLLSSEKDILSDSKERSKQANGDGQIGVSSKFFIKCAVFKASLEEKRTSLKRPLYSATLPDTDFNQAILSTLTIKFKKSIFN